MGHRKLALLSLLACLGTLSTQALSQKPFWPQYGRDAQHTGQVTTGIQTMNSVLWQTPVDLRPPYSGTDLLIHYGSPLVAGGGTIVLAVRTGPSATFPTTNDTYEFEGLNPMNGSVIYTLPTDFVDWMPHNWTPDVGAVIDGNNKLYVPGPGGTVIQRSSADAATATTTQFCFYGLSSYNANPTAFNGNVQICTPITVDAANNIYFGFYVASGFGTTQGNSPGLSSGIAKISSTGVGSWVSADKASGDTGDEVATNSAPAVSADGKYLYVAVKQSGDGGYNNPKLLRLSTANLATVSLAALQGPTATNDDTTFPYIFDDGTASPTVGPDGDVYFGIWYSIIDRGFMLHYSSDLSKFKTPGAFGWDDTAAIVPATAVPGYKGTSKYLILTKYNNYADAGAYGDGQNKIALLDPNATELWTPVYGSDATGTLDTDSFTTMQEIETLLGPTSNTAEGLEGVREWCINMAAIDVLNKSAVVNSEDGHAYRWSFGNNSITSALDLATPTGEAYTMTISGQDGMAYAINNATLFAMWDGVKPSVLTPFEATLIGGNSTNCTLTLAGPATGPGATIQLSSNNANVTVPATVFVRAGTSSASFTISSKAVDGLQPATITASRYGFSTTANMDLSSSAIYSVSLSAPSLYGDQSGTGTVFLSGASPNSGRTITLSSSLPSITFPTKTFKITDGADYGKFTYDAAPVGATVSGTITATLDDGTYVTTSITNNGPSLYSLSLSPAVVIGGETTVLTIQAQHPVPASGVQVAMDYSAHSYGPGTILVGSNDVGTAKISTTATTTGSYTETITASYDGTTKSTTIVVTPPATLSKFTINEPSVNMTGVVTGTVTLSSPATSNTVIGAKSIDPELVISTYPTVAKGETSASFKIVANVLTTDAAHTSTVYAYCGSKTLTNSITVNPIVLTSISASSTVLHAGQTATITFNASAPTGVSILEIPLKSSNTARLTAPAYGQIKIGASSGTATVTAASTQVGTNTVTVTATLLGKSVTQTFTVEP
jgi:hypothetical protein